MIGSISRWRRGVFFVLYISWKYSGFRPVGDMCDTECDTPQIRLDTPCDTHFDSFGPFGLYLYRGSSQLESPITAPTRQQEIPDSHKFPLPSVRTTLFPPYHSPYHLYHSPYHCKYSSTTSTNYQYNLPVLQNQYYKLPVQLPVQPVTSFQCGTQCGTQLFPSSHYPTHTTNPHPTIPPTSHFPLKDDSFPSTLSYSNCHHQTHLLPKSPLNLLLILSLTSILLIH